MDAGTIARLKESVENTRERELAINRHLGYPDDYQRGTLVVHIKWSELEELVKIAEKEVRL